VDVAVRSDKIINIPDRSIHCPEEFAFIIRTPGKVPGLDDIQRPPP
jgi:hypothetical protein